MSCADRSRRGGDVRVRPRKIRSRRGENPSQPWKDLWKEFVGNGGTWFVLVIDYSGNFNLSALQ